MKTEAFQLPDNFSLVCKSQPDADLLRKWDPGDEPYEQSLKIEECPIRVLKMRRMPSFVAMLHHKLEIIRRAHGSLRRAAKAMGIGYRALKDYVLLRTWGDYRRSRLPFAKIDREYAVALEMILLQELKSHRSTKHALTKKRQRHAQSTHTPENQRTEGHGEDQRRSERPGAASDEARSPLHLGEGRRPDVH